jgi:FkbM family methyltransferase
MLTKLLKLVRYFRRKSQWEQIAPYDYVQRITEQNIHQYLGIDHFEVKNWCIVGGYLGLEIPRVIANYPNAVVTIFECSERYVDKLRANFESSKNVHIVNKAVSNKSGVSKFYETNLHGSGSLLELGDLHIESYNSSQAESFEVETITLDEFFGDEAIDVIQIDVQGAERLVVEGGTQVLRNAGAIFVETSGFQDLYKDSVTFDELYSSLRDLGFTVALVGTDTNLTGNALFLNSKSSIRKS